MADKVKKVEEKKVEEKTVEEKNENLEYQKGVTNSEVKNHPLFAKLTADLAEKERRLQIIEDEKKRAEQEAEIKKAESEADYKKALELRDQQLKAEKEKYEKEIQSRDIQTELIKLGFKNSKFLRGCVADYDGKTPIGDYVKLLAEENKDLLDSVVRTVIPAPNTPNAQGTNNTYSLDQLKEMEKSKDPKQRQIVYDYIYEFSKSHGGQMPW
jgi:hypothetical protein